MVVVADATVADIVYNAVVAVGVAVVDHDSERD